MELFRVIGGNIIREIDVSLCCALLFGSNEFVKEACVVLREHT